MQPSPNLISPQIITPDQGGILTTDQSKIDHTKDLTMNYIMGSSNAGESSSRSPGDADAEQRIMARLEEKYGSASLDKLHRPANPGEAEGVEISGLMAGRVLHGLMNDRGRGFHMDEEEAFQLMDDLLAPHKEGMTPEEQKAANDRFDTGMNQYKGILMDDLKHKEKQFGALVTQMHPEDVLPQIGQQTLGQDDPFLQDTIQFRQMGGKYLDPGNRDDQKFIDLAEYYNNTAMALIQYKMMAHGGEKSPFAGVSPDTMLNDDNEYVRGIREREDRIEGPRMNPEQLAEYRKDLKKRAKSESYLKNRLFGRFKK